MEAGRLGGWEAGRRGSREAEGRGIRLWIADCGLRIDAAEGREQGAALVHRRGVKEVITVIGCVQVSGVRCQVSGFRFRVSAPVD